MNSSKTNDEINEFINSEQQRSSSENLNNSKNQVIWSTNDHKNTAQNYFDDNMTPSSFFNDPNVLK